MRLEPPAYLYAEFNNSGAGFLITFVRFPRSEAGLPGCCSRVFDRQTMKVYPHPEVLSSQKYLSRKAPEIALARFHFDVSYIPMQSPVSVSFKMRFFP